MPENGSLAQTLVDFQTDLKKDPGETVVISGAGPAGLSLALNLIRKDPKKKIVIVEARENKLSRIRPQLVHLNEEVRAHLTSLIPKDSTHKKDEIFKIQLANDKEHIAIKDIQRFYKRRLKEEKNCTFLYGSKITEIDTVLNTVNVATPSDQKSKKTTITHDQTIQFKHLIDAGGSHHDIADILKGKGVPIEYKRTFKSKRECMVSTYLRVQKKDGSEVELPDSTLRCFDSKMEDVTHRAFVYFNRYSHTKKQGKQLKFYVTSSIPEDDFKKYVHNKEQGIDFLKSIACRLFDEKDYMVSPVESSRKHPAAKDPLKFLPFRRVFYKVNTAGLSIGNGSCLFIGDAGFTPDFYQGMGTNNAILQGIDAADYLSGAITLEIFNDISELRAHEQLLQTLYIENADELEDDRVQYELGLLALQCQIYKILIYLKKLKLSSLDKDFITHLSEDIADFDMMTKELLAGVRKNIDTAQPIPTIKGGLLLASLMAKLMTQKYNIDNQKSPSTASSVSTSSPKSSEEKIETSVQWSHDERIEKIKDIILTKKFKVNYLLSSAEGHEVSYGIHKNYVSRGAYSIFKAIQTYEKNKAEGKGNIDRLFTAINSAIGIKANKGETESQACCYRFWTRSQDTADRYTEIMSYVPASFKKV